MITSSKTNAIRNILMALVFLYLLFPDELNAAWYDHKWRYRKQITINESMIPDNGDLTDFPVMILEATDDQLRDNAQADGDDILFTSSDETTKIDHEIELFVSSDGEIIAWVEIPTLDDKWKYNHLYVLRLPQCL